MSLNHIPKRDTPFPFLHEVDFPKLAELMAGGDPARPKIIRPAGREEDIDGIRLDMLSAGANNIWLQGAEGVGKTSIISGLLQKIAQRRVTPFMLSKHIYIFDAHCFFKCDAKDAYKEFDNALDFLNRGNSLLIFDRIDDFVGMAGTDASYYLNGLAETSRGSLQTIITSQVQNRDKIDKLSTAITPNFVERVVKEPNREDILAILRTHRPRLEGIHKVRIPEETIQEVVRILNRYPGRAFTSAAPQAQISFLDKSAAYVRLSGYGLAPEITRKIEQVSELEDELESLKVSSRNTEKRRAEIATQLATLHTEIDGPTKEWEAKYKPYADIRNKIADTERQIAAIEQKRFQIGDDGEQRKVDLEPSDRKKLDILKDSLETLEESALAISKQVNPEIPVVTRAHAQLVFSKASGISASTISGGDRERLLNAETMIGKNLFGQSAAVSIVANALRDARAGVSDPSRPAGVVLHTGPTGTGKTEIVKVLAVVDGGEGALPIIIKMNQFQDRSSLSAFTGAAPGLVGFEKGAPHLEKIKKNPRGIPLLDELEKADEGLFDLIMQILDEGSIDTNAGEVVNFKEAILNMTTNAVLPEDLDGYKDLRHGDAQQRAELLGDQDLIRKALRTKINPKTGRPFFRPEFVERIDTLIMYDYLDHDAAFNILRRKQIEGQNLTLASRNVRLEMDDDIARAIVDKFYNVAGGGRSVRQLFNQRIRPLISTAVLKLPDAKDDEDIRTLYIDFDGKDVTLAPSMPARRPGLVRDFPTAQQQLTQN